MLISDSHQFVFVHIRKAAGTSLRQILEQVSLPKNNHWWYKLLSRGGLAIDYHNYSYRKHANLVEAERSMPADKFTSYFKFAVVRNPWDRLVSEYEYIKTQPTHSRFKRLKAFSFAEFVEFQAKRPAAHQVNALRLKSGEIGCDYIGKLETLDESLEVIAKFTGLNFEHLPHINKIQRRDYRNYYDDDLVSRVGSLWFDDIRNFDYQFDKVAS
ncbi:sulfotransferase family 2 domain-containing protein [Marinicella sp. S1101]|uniref:sulfotransferase family 2 domain-containing protein n=1 Tax=Marinicella marina TaxID=2996016 RepID=UPI0022610287|nr:sulfotransferase family 2 domain-containing protein [Marinicella marina]MCX7553458.1 sulfotransferase family 2 domain-containing protein [Marinicella marina]MDJ1140082.1 sulfotransferase family 2 domain-containing protein [Marinicella marina]